MCIANTYKGQRLTVNTVHFLYKLAETRIMPGTNQLTTDCNTSRKHTWISIFKIPKAKSGMPEYKNQKKVKWTSIFFLPWDNVPNQHHANITVVFTGSVFFFKGAITIATHCQKNIRLTVK